MIVNEDIKFNPTYHRADWSSYTYNVQHGMWLDSERYKFVKRLGLTNSMDQDKLGNKYLCTTRITIMMSDEEFLLYSLLPEIGT